MWKVGWALIYVSDMKRAVEFYEGKLGIPVRDRSDDFPEFVTLDTEGTATLALHKVDDESAMAGQTSITLSVPDLQATYEAASAKGVQFVRSPEQQLWGGLMVSLSDPDGNVVDVLQEMGG